MLDAGRRCPTRICKGCSSLGDSSPKCSEEGGGGTEGEVESSRCTQVPKPIPKKRFRV